MTDVKITTVYTVKVPIYPPRAPEANTNGVPTEQVLYLNDALAKELYQLLVDIVGL